LEGGFLKLSWVVVRPLGHSYPLFLLTPLLIQNTSLVRLQIDLFASVSPKLPHQIGIRAQPGEFSCYFITLESSSTIKPRFYNHKRTHSTENTKLATKNLKLVKEPKPSFHSMFGREELNPS